MFGAAIACALLGFADDYTKLVKRRSLGLRGAHQADRDDRDLDRPLVHRARRRRTCRAMLFLRFVDYHIDLGPLYPV